MGFMTSGVALRARTALRKAGVARVAMNFLRSHGYEQALTRSMRASIQPGDVIWDVGANIGEYAVLFSRWTGQEGTVYAFEPDLGTADRLRGAVIEYPQATVLAKGLSDHDGVASFVKDDHPDGATFRVAAPGEIGNDVIVLATGDGLVQRGEIKTPDVIKIDIEGHELEALLGMEAQLATAKHVFIEVHFFILADQHRGDVPKRIEALLKKHGLKVGWVDQSHIHAARS